MAKQAMGIGRLGFNNLVFKRKFRFTFTLEDICGGQSVPEHYVKTAAKPNLEIESTEINFLNATTWIPGKGKWQTMNLTYLDVATADAAPLYTWLASVYNFTNSVTLEQGSARKDYTATGILKSFDGCGQLIDVWVMLNMFPTSIDFGDVDYSSSEISEIALTLQYSDVAYASACPSFGINPCCSPCTGAAGAGSSGAAARAAAIAGAGAANAAGAAVGAAIAGAVSSLTP